MYLDESIDLWYAEYVDFLAEKAFIVSSEVTYWGYHDESEWDKHAYTVSLEQAFEQIRSEKGTQLSH